MAKQVPRTDADFLAWHDNFKTQVAALAATFGLTAAQVTALTDRNTDLHTTSSDLNAAKATTQAKTQIKSLHRRQERSASAGQLRQGPPRVHTRVRRAIANHRCRRLDRPLECFADAQGVQHPARFRDGRVQQKHLQRREDSLEARRRDGLHAASDRHRVALHRHAPQPRRAPGGPPIPGPIPPRRRPHRKPQPHPKRHRPRLTHRVCDFFTSWELNDVFVKIRSHQIAQDRRSISRLTQTSS